MSVQDKRLREDLRGMIALCRSCRKRSAYSRHEQDSLGSMLKRIERELSAELLKIEAQIREARRITDKEED